MFGFLIAMIKGTFDRIKKEEVSNKYVSRCEMNQVSYNFYRKVPFNVDFETDLVVVSGLFADPIEINLKADEIWRKKVEQDIKLVKTETTLIKEETAEIKQKQDKLISLIENLLENQNPKSLKSNPAETDRV